MKKFFQILELLYLLLFLLVWGISLFVDLNFVLLLCTSIVELIFITIRSEEIGYYVCERWQDFFYCMVITILIFFITIAIGENIFMMKFIYPRQRIIDNVFMISIYLIVERFYYLLFKVENK